MALLEAAFRDRPSSTAVAKLDQITKRFGEVTALDRFDLEVHPGEVVSLLGPNGAGKTTAVKVLLGLLRPDSGDARLFGGPPWNPARRARMGAMLQVSRVPDTLRVGEHITLFRSYYPQPLPLPDIVTAAGLQGLEKRPYGELSGGQRQRLLFALALCGDPDLLVLDEPTVGLDVKSRRRLWETVRAFVAKGGTVLLTTHYLEEADALADRVVLLRRGRVVASGSPDEIKDRAAGRLIRCVTDLTEASVAQVPGVRSVRREGRSLEVVGEAEDGRQALAVLEETAVDVVVTDIEMPDMTGLELAQELRRQRPRPQVVILTTFARPGYLRRALDAGAAGYLLKDAPAERLAEAVRRVHAGGRAVDPELAAEAWWDPDPLTDRERQVLRRAGDGLSTAAIAAGLHLSEGAVRNYLSEAISKLQASNRVEAARIARRKGGL